MKRLFVLLAVLSLGGACFAGTDSNQLARVREKLREWGGVGFNSPNSMQASLTNFLKRENLTLEDVSPEVERLAVEANDHLDLAKQDAPKGAWETVCSRMVITLGKTGDRRFLPTIERLALTAHDKHNRVDAVNAHIDICGFGSFGFIKQAVEAQPDTLEGRNTRFGILELTFKRMNGMALSHEQLEEIQKYLLGQAMTETNAFMLVQADEFLVKRLPEYARSKQRLFFAGKQNLNDPTDQMKGYFSPIKDELLKLPTTELKDLRSRFPGLPPLPEEKASEKPLKVALVVGAALAALVAVYAAVWLTAKRRKTRNHADGQPNLR